MTPGTTEGGRVRTPVLLCSQKLIPSACVVLPEMRTSLRSYHPVPSLQKVDPNLQDAPRIKNILKACHLAGEADALPVTPAELRTKIVSTYYTRHVRSQRSHAEARQAGACPPPTS